MYRTSSGNHKFSFSRFINAAVPNLAAAPHQNELSDLEQDQVFEYQILVENPHKLDPLASFIAGITRSKTVSGKIHSALIKNGVFSEDSQAINTRAITPNFPHQLSMISSFAQKKLVNLLFFWEEEQQRWRVLQEEEAEIRTVIGAEREIGSATGTLETRLKELEGLIRLKPSLRSSHMRDATPLPRYTPRRRPSQAQVEAAAAEAAAAAQAGVHPPT
ncbi:hypothetical protein K432DRAFT_9755 [Lepidopterella palustris CBS 459.81]|uniref:Uncharacterized protein n=1 Tax=Lepidopterella palustris CBS 459.81 TaxID=1314670 RepID=A0A8E2ED15_9PEZI|nr:hypothetical protein K432DRAFT_9755 [Lepidopterella palustris CBS 459.81]